MTRDKSGAFPFDPEIFNRSIRLLGLPAMTRLASARVAVFGIGGVGSFVAEGLSRSGIGALELFDSDTVEKSNLNRQLFALCSTLGLYKVDAARARLQDINPDMEVCAHRLFVDASSIGDIDFSRFDFAVDAVDTVTTKVLLAAASQAAGIPFVSSMGTGNKLDASAFCIGPLESTRECPLARVMRRLCKERGLASFPVLYSLETPVKPTPLTDDGEGDGLTRSVTPASTATVPSTAGMLIANFVVRSLLKG